MSHLFPPCAISSNLCALYQKLVAASDSSDAFTTFSGVTRLQQGITPSGSKIDMDKSNDPNVLPLPRGGVDITRPMERERPSPTERLNVITPDRYNQRVGGSNNNSPISPQRDRGMGEGVIAGRTRAVTTQERAPVSMGMGVGMGLPTRANTLAMAGPRANREPRADTPPNQDGESAPPPPVKSAPAPQMREPVPQQQMSRLTEVYDDLLEGYTGENSTPTPPLPSIPEENKRIQAWARSAGNAPPPSAMDRVERMDRMGTPSRSMSMRAPSSYGGTQSGGMRRSKSTRPLNAPNIGGRYGSNNSSRANSRVVSGYEVGDEDDGYRSAEYEEPEYEMIKVRVKVSPYSVFISISILIFLRLYRFTTATTSAA